MPSFDPSFGFSFSFSDFGLDELGVRFLSSIWCQACEAFSSSSIVYAVDKSDVNMVLSVLTILISFNKSETLPA
jgi:hypothetical protein